MSDTGKRFLGWSVESIVGNIVWSLLCALGLFYFNERTGCVYIVLDSMRGHELELAGWTIAFALFGALVGLMVRHRIAIRQLDDKDSAAKERISSELADIEGFKQVDSLDALVEKARGLSSLNDQLAAEIAARDAEIAEVRHSRDRQLEKYRNVFDLDRFDVRSCRVMFEVYEAESGPRGALYLSSDNLVAASLISEGVLDMYGSTLRDGRHAFRLTPEWRRFIRGNLNELRERLAEVQRDAGEDGDDRASARGKIAEAEREDPR